MVARVLITILLATAASAWGGTAQPRQLCLSCHPPHHTERGGCSGCHRGNPVSERKNIAHAGLRAGKYARFTLGDPLQIKAGERLMTQFACRRCHVSGGRGNRLAVSLDDAAVRKTAGELALSIRRPVANMPTFALDEETVTALVNAVLVQAQGHEAATAAPVRVHFSTSGKKSSDIFSTKCGSCHRILSQRLGAAGTGDVGPNLSGLLSEWYPATYKNSEAWSPRNLRSWLKNPRESRPLAKMLPVQLTGEELKELESIIITKN